jgi:hypothetical protein
LNWLFTVKAINFKPAARCCYCAAGAAPEYLSTTDQLARHLFD